MGEVSIKRLGDIESSHGGSFSLAGKALGATAFGINVLRLPPNTDAYPEHDHSEDGQEEVYVVVFGAATLQVEGEEHELTPITLARVPAGTKRRWVTGDEGVTLVAVGGVPGGVYTPRA